MWLAVALSLLLMILSALALPALLALLPEDYFCNPERRSQRLQRCHPAIYWLTVIGKNILGVLLLAAGVAMLFLPGQGLLTILMSLILLDFPGKHRLERQLVCRPGVLNAINWLRHKANRQPMRLPQPTSDQAPQGRRQ